MEKKVIKRDGRIVEWDTNRIQTAIFRAAYNGQIDGEYIGSYHINPVKANMLANTITRLVKNEIREMDDTIDIESIQNIVVKHLNKAAPRVGKAYLTYKTEQAITRGL